MIQCPKCTSKVPNENINIQTDLAQCISCHHIFTLSQSVAVVQKTDAPTFNIQQSPGGAWCKSDHQSTIFGATTRSPAALFIVPFICVWAGFSLSTIYAEQIQSGEFSLFDSLFGLPFLMGSILFGALAIMTVIGKVEITANRQGAKVFVGVAMVGWSKHFKWSQIHSIYTSPSYYNYPGNQGTAIVVEGQNQFRFGSGLNDERRHYILNVLKVLHQRYHGG